MISSLQYKHEWRAVVGVLYVFVPWWLAHWEEYHTGVMLYGNGMWGVTEANYAVVLLHWYTFALGPIGWTWRPFTALFAATGLDSSLPPVLVDLLRSMGVNDLLLLTFGFMGASLLAEQVYRVFKLAGTQQVRQTTMPPAEQGSKTVGRGAAMWHLAQIFGTCAIGGLLVGLPITDQDQARVLFATFGITYAMQATRLIMAHMTKEPFSVAAWPLVLMSMQIGNYFVPLLDPRLLTLAVNAVVIAGYLHYVIGIIGEICESLGIRALTIKPNMD